jgi:hypothetical protein
LVATVDSEEDARLWQRVVDGDRAALGLLYDRYGGLMLALARRIMGDAGSRRISSTTSSWRPGARPPTSMPARGSVRAWLVLRLRSRALDRRKSAGFARVDSIDAEPGFQVRAEEPRIRRSRPIASDRKALLAAAGRAAAGARPRLLRGPVVVGDRRAPGHAHRHGQVARGRGHDALALALRVGALKGA